MHTAVNNGHGKAARCIQHVDDRLNRARSRLGGYKTPPYANRARSRRQANSSRGITGWPTAMCMQANCPLDEPSVPGNQQRRSRRGSYRQCQINFMPWRLPPGGNRTPLKGVIVRPLPANTLGLQTMQSSPRPV